MENYNITTEAQSITGAINENDQQVDKIDFTGITFNTPGDYYYDAALYDRMKNDIANDTIVRCVGNWNILFIRDYMDTSSNRNPVFNYMIEGKAYTIIFYSTGKCTVSYYEPSFSIYYSGLNMWNEGTYSSSPELLQTFINAWQNNRIIGLWGTTGKSIIYNMGVDSSDSPSAVSLVYEGTHPRGHLKRYRTVISSMNVVVKILDEITYDESDAISSTAAMNAESDISENATEIVIFK